jgi:sugar lactone lactonase YvrE
VTRAALDPAERLVEAAAVMDRRRAFGWIALTATLGVGCFPDDALHTDAGGDAANDLGRTDATVTDAGPRDVPRFDVVDAGLPADMGVADAGPSDAGSDASDTGPVIEGPACEMAPAMASSRLVFDALPSARDFVFDGLGGVAVAQGSTVALRRAGETTPVTMVMTGEVVALRFTRSAGLVLAVFNNTGSGTGNGAIYQVAPGSTTPTLLQSGLRQPGGLAVDAADRIWFSDTTMNSIYRLPPNADAGTGAQVVVTDVPSPTQLLVDAQGRYLFVARSDTNTVMRLELGSGGDGGTIGAAMPFVGGFSRVSGLAQDECGNVFVADEIVDRIWRVPILAGDAVRVVTDVRGPRSLMFGVGAPFGPRELYALSAIDGTLRAANLVARGVPLAVPAR